jgi:uncharacterized protein YbjQ (UPF0145 family)
MTHPAHPEGPYRTGAEATADVVVTTSNDVEGYRIVRYLGIVRGVIVRSASIGQGFVGALKSIGGGNIDEWAQVCEAARHDAYTKMMDHARELGAHGVIGMRYDATEFMQGATEVLAYGTAVLIEQKRPQ